MTPARRNEMALAGGWGFQPKFYDLRLGPNQFFTLLRGHLLLRSLRYARYSRMLISSGPRLTLILPGVASNALSVFLGSPCSCPSVPGGRYLSHRSAGRRGAPPEASVYTFPGGHGSPPSRPVCCATDPGAASAPFLPGPLTVADRSSVPAGRAGRNPGDPMLSHRTPPQPRVWKCTVLLPVIFNSFSFPPVSAQF
ncbi:hypothetical protein NDU88_003017 [Pleurodeles waltl]|uniref:Uncharacterized protein n=1 Tax=Pleurodeles waltl TaxID=8319 RepID=A0AAV7UZF5_PLEWA|nr:hypothetical protein NDU88_003017 [Pleurodeles waltl]